MRLVLGIATVLGIVGPIAAFGLFYLGDKVFHLDHAHLQTLMYLTLSVAGHLTIFLARTRGPFWSIRPARILVLAVIGTQVVATLIAVYGIFMTPIGWRYAALVWGYAMACFLLTDRVKLVAYRVLDLAPDPTRGAKRHASKGGFTDPGRPTASVPRQAAAKVSAVPFHTNSDPGDPVYHDNDDCPHGQTIKQHGNDIAGTGGHRRCDWCVEHAPRRAPQPAGTPAP